MNIAKLIDILRYYNLSEKIYIQVGFNRFDIQSVDMTDDGVILTTTDNANNPPSPSYTDNRAA